MSLPIVPETHQQGVLSIENLDFVQAADTTDCDVGVQLHDDGRIWICVDGVAFLRFKPTPFRREVHSEEDAGSFMPDDPPERV